MPSSVLAIKHPDGHLEFVTEGQGEPVMLRTLDFQNNAAEDMGKVMDSMDDLIEDAGWGIE